MQKDVHLTVSFPGNLYGLRSVKILDENDQVIHYVRVGDQIHFTTNSAFITARLDFYRSKISLAESVNYLSLHLKGNHFAGHLWYSLKKDYMHFVCHKSKEEWHDSLLEKGKRFPEISIDHISVITLCLILATFLYTAVFQVHSPFRNFLFLYGILGMITLLPYLFRKRSGLAYYSNRMIFTSLLGAILIIVSDILQLNAMIWGASLLLMLFIAARAYIRYRAEKIHISSHTIS